MALILNIETSTTNCSVALSKDGKTISLKQTNKASYSHAKLLHQHIDEVFKDSNLSRTTIDAVAVSKGPGSYTGLRIGVSTAKGLCYALNKPLIALPTLEVLAHQVKIKEGYIIPMLDARRMEVYASIFDSNYQIIRETQSEILTENAYQKYLAENKVSFIGSGVVKTKTLINHPNAEFILNKLPSANEMGFLSEKKFKTSNFEDIAYFEPSYLKDFQGQKLT